MPDTQITTGKVRFSYCNLFTPKAQQGSDKLKYSVTLLIPKTDGATLSKIENAIFAAKAAYTLKGKKLPKDLKTTMHDGDDERPTGGDFGTECTGCYVITVSSDKQPIIVYADKTPVTDERELWSGCYGKAIINFYVYDNAGNKGVTAGLNGIMKLHDGEPLTGGVVTDTDWDDDFGDPETDLLD